MKRSSSSFNLSYGIPGDELEQDRIQLEHNLQHTDLSFRLSSQGDEYNNNDSIEYPRHNSAPSPFPDFGSFIHRSGGEFEGDTQHAWSYRTGDDDEGIHPYGGETMSTAAHHASALTLTAGLGGARGARREASFSGAEYDPDRPLHDIIGGVDSRLSIFDADPSRSKYTAGGVTFDPVIVDSTAELDRILESGHAPPPALHSRSARAPSTHSSAASSSSESEVLSPRPKISDALRRVSFSPKRPRSPLPYHSPHHRTSKLPPSHSLTSSSHPALSPLAREASLVGDEEQNLPTPKPRQSSKRINAFNTPQPEVRLQPPTPSSSTSKFTQKARGLAKELQAEVEHARQPSQHKARSSDSKHAVEMMDLESPAVRRTGLQQRSFNSSRYSQGNISKSRIHLPDVTGLTNAVESPAKGALNHYPYQGSKEPRDVEVHLLTAMNAIQSKLEHLEDENGISRRRVRELEHELEVCKREVARERTRVLEKEDAIMQNQRELERAVADAKRTMKGKAKARDTSVNSEANASVRYKEAVAEKKALESLISTLRAHLTRLTAELSSHQQLLIELRTLRESDARAMREKSAEVARLRDEVERLAGEVEVLRGVVEEGLKERRLARENSQISGQPTASQGASESLGIQEALEETKEDGEDLAHENETIEAKDGEEDEDEDEDEDDFETDEEPEPFDPISIPGSSRENVDIPDKTMRTDHATLGTHTTNPLSTSKSDRFIDDAELERISADVEERRSERSVSGVSQSQFNSKVLAPSRSVSPALMASTLPSRRATVADASDMDESIRNPTFADEDRASSPVLSSRSLRLRRGQQEQHSRSQLKPNTSRPAAPTPAHATTHNARSSRPADTDASVETPFPQIRGERLEKLFFSAPEHNAKTCTVCLRRQGPKGREARPTSPSWLPSRIGQVTGHPAYHNHDDEDDDEGFAEGFEEAESMNERDRVALETKRRGKQKESARFSDRDPVQPYRDRYEQRRNLPQQTVLSRVIRELEDDFAHYKSVYVELADQYKEMDPVSDVPRRNLLAQHLREVVDVLEQKGDQIASLYDLLTFKDKAVSESTTTGQLKPRPAQAANSLRAATGLRRHPTFA